MTERHMARESKAWPQLADSVLFGSKRHEGITKLLHPSHRPIAIVRSRDSIHHLNCTAVSGSEPAQSIRHLNEVLALAPQLPE